MTCGAVIEDPRVTELERGLGQDAVPVRGTWPQCIPRP